MRHGGLMHSGAAMAYRASARRVEIALLNLGYAVKFDADQPRAPAGHPGGGQWISSDFSSQTGANIQYISSSNDVLRISSFAQKHSIAAKPDGYDRCLDLCYPLLERFKQPIWSDRNTWDFHKCMNACLKSESKGF